MDGEESRKDETWGIFGIYGEDHIKRNVVQEIYTVFDELFKQSFAFILDRPGQECHKLLKKQEKEIFLVETLDLELLSRPS